MHSGDGYPFEQALNRVYIHKANHLVFLTNHVKKLVLKEIPFIGTPHVIPHGIIKPEGVISKTKELKENPKLLFLGRINKYKGIEDLFQAVKGLDPDKYEKLIIAGKSSYSMDFVQHEKVELIDKWLTENELSSLVNDCDVLILPYKEATQSGIVTIGIAGALPMICTNVGGIEEQLKPDKEALFVQSNPESIRNGILKLISDKKLYLDISRNLQEKSLTLDWQNIANEVSELL